MRFNINYYNVRDLENSLRAQALKIILPMIDDLLKIKLNYNNKKPYIKFYSYSYHFTNSIIVNYALAVKADKKLACDKALSEGILFKLGNFVLHDERRNNVFNQESLSKIQLVYQEALEIYNQAYKEAGCKN